MARFALAVVGLLGAFALLGALFVWGVALVSNHPNLSPLAIFLALATLYSLIVLYGLSRWQSLD